MRTESKQVWWWVIATLILVSSCGKQDGSDSATLDVPEPTAGVFAPADDGAEAWGAFDFYRTHATLAAFQGHLALEAAGRLPKSSGEALAGAHVYKIVNAQEFHEGNKGRDIRCLAPALWLAIKPTDGGVHIALLTAPDWKGFDPKKPGLCGSGSYRAE